MVTGNNTASSTSYIDASLTPSNIDELNKYLFVHPSFFQIALFDIKTRSFCGLKSIERTKTSNPNQDLHSLFDDSWLRSRKKTKAIVSTSKCTLVPKSLFNHKNLYEILSLEHDIKKNDTLQSIFIKELDAQFIFANREDWAKFFDDLDIDIIHSFPHFSRTILKDFEDLSNVVFINNLELQVEITVLKSNQLHLHNYYDCKTDADFLYFSMLAFENLNLNPEITPTVLFGQINHADEKHTALLKYIRNLKFASFPKSVKVVPELLEAPSHLYYNLMTAAL